MIQVRCPECGYLQTLSEEKFLAISDDFLNCPHCHARLPKKWSPAHPENIPEEARHKIIAFSRRILNGGTMNRAVVTALEALVRRYGQMECSLKALGVGYGSLGEHKKAEEFFTLAVQESPEDIEMLRWLARVKLALEKYDEAYLESNKVMQIVGNDVADEDIATAALALIGLGRSEEGRTLLDSHPDLDDSRPLVKQAMRKLGRQPAQSNAGWRSAFSLFNDLLSWSNKMRLQTLRDKAIRLMKSRKNGRGTTALSSTGAFSLKTRSRMFDRSLPEKTTPRKLFLEYWIYSPNDSIPDWEAVRSDMDSSGAGDPQLAPRIAQMNHLIQTNALSIEYVKKEEAEELFSYPEDVLPRNSRGLSPRDVDRVVNARLIVRVRFVQKVDDPAAWLKFVVCLVDRFRSVTEGVVQDVISHTLWGEAEWKKNSRGLSAWRLDFHINCEAVEESNGLWIHTHGMQKFGLPELELEAVPNDLAVEASRLVFMIAQSLLDLGGIQGSHAGPFHVRSAPYSFTLTMKNPDDEAHFPGGSAIVSAFVTSSPSKGPEGLREVLSRIGANIDEHSGVPDPSSDTQEADALRERMLEAHRQARRKLPQFKKSFRNLGTKDNYVHAIKVKFDSETGDHEWMWVSLNTWKGRSVEGILENDPVLIKRLQKGSRVNITDQDIFDWAIVTDGRLLDGGFTEALRADSGRSNIEAAM